MKNLAYIIIVLFTVSCNSDKGWDCFKSAGNIETRNFQVGTFSKIRIEGEVSLNIKQSETVSVSVESGENLFGNISVTVEGETLVIKDLNSCNLVRDYGLTIASVSVTNLTEIRNSSSFDVRSEGVLNFPNLSLISDTTGGIEDVRKGGDFYLNLNCEDFALSANGQSIFYITGNSQNATIVFSDEQPRFNGENFIIQNLSILQRSANKMIVNPIQKISGIIYGTGDVIAVNRPQIIEIEQRFTGTLIIQD